MNLVEQEKFEAFSTGLSEVSTLFDNAEELKILLFKGFSQNIHGSFYGQINKIAESIVKSVEEFKPIKTENKSNEIFANYAVARYFSVDLYTNKNLVIKVPAFQLHYKYLFEEKIFMSNVLYEKEFFDSTKRVAMINAKIPQKYLEMMLKGEILSSEEAIQRKIVIPIILDELEKEQLRVSPIGENENEALYKKATKIINQIKRM